MAFPGFNLEKRGSTRIWVSGRFADPPFVDALADADRFFNDPQCQIIKDQKKIKVGRLSLTIAGRRQSIYIKKYNGFSFRFRLFSSLLRSGALRSLAGANVLRAGGIATANLVAAVESRSWGMIHSSFFVSQEIAGGKTADAYWLESTGGYSDRRALLRGLARLFHALHTQGIYHNDLKDANILIATKSEFAEIECFLLDLEGVRRCARLSERRRIKNLVQLYRTLGRHVPRSRQIYFLKCYLGSGFDDRNLKRKLVDRVLRAARRVDRAKAQERKR